MTERTPLPPAETPRLTVGYMRLTDAAPLLLARDHRLYERYGLEVTLQREVSWANLRDGLVAGTLDAAQLLAPLPFATGMGAGGLRASLLTGLSLGLNGNAITVSGALGDELGLAEQDGADARELALRLGNVIRSRPPGTRLTFATVHAFSMHSFLLHHWLSAGGIDPDRDLRLIVLPPEQMCDSLARGIIDGFCAGEPWGSIAVQQGIGAVATSGYQVWNNAPEKVLGVTENWHQQHPATHLRLRLAVMEACRLLDDRRVREEAIRSLAGSSGLDLPADYITPSLTGQYRFHKQTAPVAMPDFHVFWRWQACFPWRSHAEWMTHQCGRLLGKPLTAEQCSALVQQCYRPDLYREAARHLGIATPRQDSKTENRHSATWTMEDGIELGPDLML